jgi:hypothetical protein
MSPTREELLEALKNLVTNGALKSQCRIEPFQIAEHFRRRFSRR